MASATGGFPWDAFFAVEETQYIVVEHDISPIGSPTTGPETIMQVTRGPISGGQFSMQVKAEIAAVGVLNSLKIVVADDSNSNGIIDPAEWQTLATATITESGGVTTAQTSTVMVPLTWDVVGVKADREDIGETLDTTEFADVTIAGGW